MGRGLLFILLLAHLLHTADARETLPLYISVDVFSVCVAASTTLLLLYTWLG